MPSQSGRAKGLMVVVVAGIVVVVGTVGLIVVATSAVVDTGGRRVVLGVASPPFGLEHEAKAVNVITRTTRRTLETLTAKWRLPTSPRWNSPSS